MQLEARALVVAGTNTTKFSLPNLYKLEANVKFIH